MKPSRTRRRRRRAVRAGLVAMGAVIGFVLLQPNMDGVPARTIHLEQSEVTPLAAEATNDLALGNRIVHDTDDLAAVWAHAELDGTVPRLPNSTVGVFVVARDTRSTCRSLADVVGVELTDTDVVVLLDSDGEFRRPCPGPSGAHAWTAFVVAIPATYAEDLTEASFRLKDG